MAHSRRGEKRLVRNSGRMLNWRLPETTMSAHEIDVRYAAQLARLNLTDEEVEKFQSQLSQVVDYIGLLNSVDLSGVEPTAHAFAVSNVWQDDVARPGLPVDQALRNAPAQRDHMIVVPKVVE